MACAGTEPGKRCNACRVTRRWCRGICVPVQMPGALPKEPGPDPGRGALKAGDKTENPLGVGDVGGFSYSAGTPITSRPYFHRAQCIVQRSYKKDVQKETTWERAPPGARPSCTMQVAYPPVMGDQSSSRPHSRNEGEVVANAPQTARSNELASTQRLPRWGQFNAHLDTGSGKPC